MSTPQRFERKKVLSESRLSDEEIIEHHESIGADFGATTPVEVVQQGLLKAVCGWHNGSTCDSILQHHGLITRRHNDGTKITKRGKAYLWETFGDKLGVTI